MDSLAFSNGSIEGWGTRSCCRRVRNCVLGMLGLMLSVGLNSMSWAESSADVLEYRVKAAFVCKFAAYVEWPSSVFAGPGSPLVIGVVAPDAVFDEIARTSAGLVIEGRPLVARRLHRGDSVANVHLLYIAHSSEAQLADILTSVKGHPVLVVTESKKGAAPGSIINFVVVKDKVRFDIAPQAAEANQLKISARLLGVARNLVGKVS